MFSDDPERYGLFGYGRDGLPGEMDTYLGSQGAVDAMADEIRQKWTKATRQRTKKLRRDVAQRLSVEIGTLASILIWFHVRRKRAPTTKVASAIDLALGVISPYSRRPVPSQVVLRRFGLPVVDDMDAFLEAARLDGVSDLAGTPLSQIRLAGLVGKVPSTIRRWRKIPAYVSRRKSVAGLEAIRLAAVR